MKPAWLTEELSQEWINLSSNEQQQPPPATTTQHGSLRINSNSRIPVSVPNSRRYSSVNSANSLLHNNSSNNSNNNCSSSSIKQPSSTSDQSIILNNNNNQPTSDQPTPPWLRAATDGMVNELLGKRPTQLQKIFQPAQPIQTEPKPNNINKSDQSNQNYDPEPRPNSSSSASRAHLARGSIGRVSNDSIRSLSIEQSSSLPSNIPFDLSLPRSSPSSHYEDLQSMPSFQSIIDHPEEESQGEQEESGHEQDQEERDDQLQMLIPPSGCNMDRLRFNRDFPLDEIIEETEPSSSIQTGWKNSNSQASCSTSRSLRSLPSSSRPPSLPFAHRTPVLDIHNRLQRVNSDLSHDYNPYNPPRQSSPDLPDNQSYNNTNTELSTGPRRFRFTYDTFTRKHLNKLTEEIHGLSMNPAGLRHADLPLKLKSILGSPGEEVTDSSTSIGLAHSTPPAIVFSSGTNKQRTFHAGRTPFSLSQRWKEEREWADSFVEPSTYAVASLSTIHRKSYQTPRAPREERLGSDGAKGSVNSLHQSDQESCRSTKRIRLESSQSSLETRHRHLKDSVTVMNERKSKRRPSAFTRAHPMVVFKSSVSASAASGTPHEKSRGPPVVVRDRLAEAKALMDRIRAKNNGAQDLESTDPPKLKQKSFRDEQAAGSSQYPITRVHNPTSLQIQQLETSECLSPSLDDQQQLAETSEHSEISEQDTSPPPMRHAQRGQYHNKHDDRAQQYHSVDHSPRNDSEAELDWDISIEGGALADHQPEEEYQQQEQEEAPQGTHADSNQESSEHNSDEQNHDRLDSVHRRLATSAAAFIRQSLGDSHGHHQSSALTSSNLAGTAGSRRQFTTQPVSREPIGRVTHDGRDQLSRSNRVSSISTAPCTNTSAPTPALTTGTTTRHSSASSHGTRQDLHASAGFEGDPKHPHQQKLGLMTIAPGDVEQLLQNARVGKMVFDSTIGKWVKVRSQSETGGIQLNNGKVNEEEHENLNSLGQVGNGNSSQEESSEEDDIFKDIESLNSKRESDSSGSRLMSHQIDDEDEDTQMTEVQSVIRHQKKQSLMGRSDRFRPKSVLKTANECLNNNNTSNGSMLSSPVDDSNIPTGVLKPSRSVSFQDGRKNGKIIGLAEEQEEQGDDRTIKDDNDQRPLNREDSFVIKKGKKAEIHHHREEKENKQNRIGASQLSDHEEDFNSNSLHQTSKILINSMKKKVRRKSSLTSTTTSNNTTTSVSNSSMITPHTKPITRNNNNMNNLSMTTTNSNNMVDDYSFELNYSKLIKIITDFEPFEPFWNSIKSINLASKSIDSVIRLNEILPALDQIDLSSNQLNYFSGLPNSLRMLIASKNQINELCSFGHLSNLEKLDLSQNSMVSLEQLSCLKHLRELKVDDNLIQDLSGLYPVDSLIKLSLKGNRIKKINFELTNWDHLEVLNLDRNQISEVTGLHHLKSVHLLNLDRNQLYSLTIDEPMPKLRVLRVNENRLESLEIAKLINLRTLYIDNNDLMEISGAGQLRKLENLSVRDQRGGELSLTLKQVRDVKRIYLGGNPLPAAFPTCQFYNLLYLELAMCQCQSLPSDLSNLIPNIRTLNLNYNFLKDLSPLKNLRRLERLTIVGSRVKSLDRGLLSVLESLPELELLDLRQNPLCASFYPPLLLSSTPSSAVGSKGGRDENVAPHINQYQIVSKDHEDDWHSMDDRFRKSLPNEFYLKRMTYRSIILSTCNNNHPKDSQNQHKLKWLDGIKISEIETKKMEKFLRGISRKLDPNHNQRDHPQKNILVDPSRSIHISGIESSRDLVIKKKKNDPSCSSHNLPQNPIPPVVPHHRQEHKNHHHPHHHQLDSTTIHDGSNSLGLIERSRY
ncbi:hypothetical protein MJO29_000071 [Puccinia striiformis f. sp. tritici]|uniref:hypothetical protein n=1 Tax=Puccinia striiformis f. sp. tritici TaxID=168172 RepID=UPI0020086550|nr:hypothetical protein Pst134EA_000067 [Puccinia striiformis f. sp. tritici]KAH9472984.1 hypothetical protein Pst134EA_000067 [Puccinia striiformis f. sp. tritici]KAI7966794.1 hypothetical protein MJO29_000071 [Puccinia striiformis f. sp. tritici]KAI9604464.1 hypothetical protein KEM48_000699 [Puccinia striiformis f. sp. tritici PST-130]